MNELKQASGSTPHLKDNFIELKNNLAAHPILEENDTTRQEPKAFLKEYSKTENNKDNPCQGTPKESTENNADSEKETKQKTKEKKGLLRRNFSIGSFRQKFKKQHSRSYSESPNNSRRYDDMTDNNNQSRQIHSETGITDEISLPMSPGGDDVFGEANAPSSSTSPFPPKPRLRHTRTLPRILPSTFRSDSQDSSSDVAVNEDKMKAVQLWQKACRFFFL